MMRSGPVSHQYRTSFVAMVAAASFLAALNCYAQYTVLRDLNSSPQFATPLIVGSNLYGTAYRWGTETVFVMNTNGTGLTTLHTFTGAPNDGSQPVGQLVLSGQSLYGMTTFGGSATNQGTIYAVNTDGSGYQILHVFGASHDDGVAPFDSLTLVDSYLYGMATSGRTPDGSSVPGVIFRINLNGTGYTNLHFFASDGSEGALASSSCSLIASGSTLYGMTSAGGSTNRGTIFKINTDGTGFTTLYLFHGAVDGSAPNGDLILSGSTLYGMTTYGGNSDALFGCGSIFQVQTDGSGFELLHSFVDGCGLPLGSLTLVSSNLYGMTSRGGTNDDGVIFQINTNGTGYASLHDFAGGLADGSEPLASLAYADGVFYGMTSLGGSNNDGVVFSYLPQPSTIPVEPQPPTILYEPLPAGTIGAVYSIELAATNGVPPYSWSVVSNALPPGLSLIASSGAITGTPTTATAAAFTVRVTGADDGYSETNYVLRILTPLNPVQLKIWLDFARPGRDRCRLKATLPANQCAEISGKPIVLTLGDAPVAFTMDARRRGVNANGTCRLTYQKHADTCTLTANLRRGSWQTTWSAYGLVNDTIPKPGTTVTLPVNITIGDEGFVVNQPLLYSAIAAAWGVAE